MPSDWEDYATRVNEHILTKSAAVVVVVVVVVAAVVAFAFKANKCF